MFFLPIGTTGTAARDVYSTTNMIYKGERVIITECHISKGYTLVNKHGNKVHETGFDSIIPDNFKILPAGTTGIATRDMCSKEGIIIKGTRVMITFSSIYHGYNLFDEHTNECFNTGFDSIIPDNQEHFSFQD